MSSRFKNFMQTPTGQLLAEIIDTPENIASFRTLSQEGKPAVQAVAEDVAPIIQALETKAERDGSSQFVGWFTAQLMREAGYQLVQERGRVSNAPYKTGAVWQLVAGTPKFVSEAPPATGLGRLTFKVEGAEGGPVATWDLTTSEVSSITGRPRRVHRISSVAKPLLVAVAQVLAYARRNGIGSIWVHDPMHLFPKASWPTA